MYHYGHPAGLSTAAATLSLQHAQADKTISDIVNLARSLNVSNRQLVRVLKTLCDESILEHPKKGMYLVKRKPEFSYKLSAER